MAALQIQEGSGKAAPDVAVTAKGRSLLGTGVSFIDLCINFDKLVNQMKS